jgi:hypothetical protein
MRIATVSDEALALLQLENSENRWTTEFSKNDNGQEVKQRDLPKPLYTSGGQNKMDQKGFTKKHGGWTEEGIVRFNRLCVMIQDDRQKNGSWFDAIIKDRMERSGELELEQNKVGRETITAYDDMVYPVVGSSLMMEDDDDGSGVGETASL